MEKSEPKKKDDGKPVLISFGQGDVLFHEKDVADCLYIIKEGKIRLYRPKGKGFIELAILKKGEVFGEMAYFNAKDARRSCSAASLGETKVIQINFNSFNKAMTSLNPWFKKIIFTMADRLRDSNDLIKSMESNSVAYSRTKISHYKFFNNSDLVKLLNYFISIFESYGNFSEQGMVLKKETLDYHILDIFNISEVKYEEFVRIMCELNYLIFKGAPEEDKNEYLTLADIQFFRDTLGFIDEQRRLDDAKRLIIPPRSQAFMEKIIEQTEGKDVEKDGTVEVNLSEIYKKFKENQSNIGQDDFLDVVSQGLAQEIVVGDKQAFLSRVKILEIRKLYPIIQFVNRINDLNDEKVVKS